MSSLKVYTQGIEYSLKVYTGDIETLIKCVIEENKIEIYYLDTAEKDQYHATTFFSKIYTH